MKHFLHVMFFEMINYIIYIFLYLVICGIEMFDRIFRVKKAQHANVMQC